MGLCLMSSYAFCDISKDGNIIGQNFEAGSFSVGGTGYLINHEVDLDFSLDTDITFFVARGSSFGLGVGGDRSYSKNSDYPSSTYRISTNYKYVFGYDPLAKKGFAFAVGLSGSYQRKTSVSLYPENQTNINIRPSVSIDYFLAPRISVYIQSHLGMHTYFSVVESHDNFNSGIDIGLRYSFARQDKAWGRKK